ncbi:uncharacterized protein [Hoplias malabaricus]|uniref:uncharacterized protein n=1 Tax=Hoplias malabaricus TaxID=27720 RepID=UPI003463028E
MNRNVKNLWTWVPLLLLTTITKGMAADLTDPCNKYTSLDQPWRGTNSTGLQICDQSFTWNGWYRLLYNGMSVRMPESCVNRWTCGTDAPLWLNGPHPQITDGIVTREVCGSWINCCYWSLSIQVKACPGNYYVYEFVSPNVCNEAYCADVNTITPNTANSTVSSTNTTDPCNNYTSLDQPWRGTNATGLQICDQSFTWNGWYRLLYYGMSVRMPESCVNPRTCGTDAPLWLNGSHPQITDGIVTREVCGSWSNCCQWSVSIQVKACPGNYYVYEFVSPNICYAAYCADVNTITPNTANSTVSSTNTTGGRLVGEEIPSRMSQPLSASLDSVRSVWDSLHRELLAWLAFPGVRENVAKKRAVFL